MAPRGGNRRKEPQASRSMDNSVMEVVKGVATMVANQQVHMQGMTQMVQAAQEVAAAAIEKVTAPAPEKEGTAKDFKKMGPEAYVGTELPLDTEAWIEQMQNYLTATRVPEDHQVEVVKLQIKDVARTWWNEEEKTLEKPILWDIFREKFITRFFPEMARMELKQWFINLKQGDSTVEEYVAEFTRLSRYAAPFVASPELKAEMFEQGLALEIRQSVIPLRLGDFGKILKVAQWTQAVINEKKQSMSLGLSLPMTATSSQGGSVKPMQKQASAPIPGQLAVKVIAVGCQYCHKQGHAIENCWRTKKKCFGCGSSYHRLRDCPEYKGPEWTTQSSMARTKATVSQVNAGLDEH